MFAASDSETASGRTTVESDHPCINQDFSANENYLRAVGNGPIGAPPKWVDWIEPRDVPAGERQAFAWMVYDEAYLFGAMVAMEGLRVVGTKRELLLLIPENLAKVRLTCCWAVLRGTLRS